MIIGIFVMIFLTLSEPSLANQKESFQYFSTKEKSFKEIQVTKYQGANISFSCMKGSALKCEAWLALQKKAKYPDRKHIGTVGNPAAIYCAAYNSKNIIFLDSKKREFDYCMFADGSVVDAWDLYNKHHK